MGELSPWHLLILAGVFVLLFGAKRLPDGARSLGRSLRIFKTEVKGLHDDEQQPQGQLPPPAPQPGTVQAPVTQAAPAVPPVPPVTPAAPVGDASQPAPPVVEQHEAR